MEIEIQTLITHCCHNKPTAQMELYKRFAPRFYPICCRIVGNRQEAEEVLHDSFLKIFGAIKSYNPGKEFEAWARTIVTHTAIDALRREPFEWDDLDENNPALTDEDEAEEAINQELIRNEVSHIKEAMLRLPDGYRAVLSLHLFEGYDLTEIAEILDLKPASVRSQYVRAKEKLLQIL